MAKEFHIDREGLANFCGRNHIAKLAFFGSVLRDDFSLDSDIDVLIDFEVGHVPGLIRVAQLERELSSLLGNRRVDLRTSQDLSRYFRNEVVATARVEYVQS